MMYKRSVFDKKNFADQDLRHNLAAIFNSKWRQTGHLPERGTYPIIVLTS